MRTYYDTFSTNIPLDPYPIHFCRSSTTFISDGYIIVPYTQCNHLTVFTSASLILVILGLFPFSSLFFYHLIMSIACMQCITLSQPFLSFSQSAFSHSHTHLFMPILFSYMCTKSLLNDDSGFAI